jgi:hypothetical protein
MSKGHKVVAIANRLRVNRSFDSAWYSDQFYSYLLMKDFLMAKTAWSFMSRASRAQAKMVAKQVLPPVDFNVDQETIKTAAADAAGPKPLEKDAPMFRVGRMFLSHMPYKTQISAFAYHPPKDGPQVRYGLFSKKKAPKPLS